VLFLSTRTNVGGVV